VRYAFSLEWSDDNRRFDLVLEPGERAYVGRSRSVAIELRYDSVSKRHCSLQVDGQGRLVVRDEGSSNGTFVGGHRIGERMLSVGEEIWFARGRLRLVEGPRLVDEGMA
jgi:pSer/pThr/pTyr-binding forkhead associated (FHA) protein